MDALIYERITNLHNQYLKSRSKQKLEILSEIKKKCKDNDDRLPSKLDITIDNQDSLSAEILVNMTLNIFKDLGYDNIIFLGFKETESKMLLHFYKT